MTGMFDKAKDVAQDRMGDLGDMANLNVDNLDMNAVGERARGEGVDPDQFKGLLGRFKRPDGKVDWGGLLEAAKGMGLDMNKIKSILGR